MTDADHTTNQLLRELIHEIRALRADMNGTVHPRTYGPGSPAYWALTTTSDMPDKPAGTDWTT